MKQHYKATWQDGEQMHTEIVRSESVADIKEGSLSI